LHFFWRTAIGKHRAAEMLRSWIPGWK
jgi:hypothetical protein